MNNKNKPPEDTNPDSPKKSLVVAIQEVASLLRTEVKIATTLKMKEKKAKILSLQMLGPSMQNSIRQVAKLLREQTQKEEPIKKQREISQSRRKPRKAVKKPIG